MGFSSNENDRLLTEQLDFMEENREISSIRLADYQQKLFRGYNRNVKPREFVAGDLVLQRLLGSMKEPSLGKLTLNWEGPYYMTVKVRVRAYYLEDLKERLFLQPWNVSNLKKHFHQILDSCDVFNSLSFVNCSKFVHSCSTLYKNTISRLGNRK